MVCKGADNVSSPNLHLIKRRKYSKLPKTNMLEITGSMSDIHVLSSIDWVKHKNADLPRNLLPEPMISMFP